MKFNKDFSSLLIAEKQTHSLISWKQFVYTFIMCIYLYMYIPIEFRLYFLDYCFDNDSCDVFNRNISCNWTKDIDNECTVEQTKYYYIQMVDNSQNSSRKAMNSVLWKSLLLELLFKSSSSCFIEWNCVANAKLIQRYHNIDAIDSI